MKDLHSIILPVGLFSVLLLSCEHEADNAQPPITNMWACHHETAWDEIRTRDSLIGRWQWEYVAHFWTAENNGYVTDEELIIEFRTDSTLTVAHHNAVVQTSTWRVVDGDADLYELDVEPGVSQLGGRIQFCEDFVLFNATYIDVSDNYFRRIK